MRAMVLLRAPRACAQDQATVTLSLNWTSMEPRRATVRLRVCASRRCGVLLQRVQSTRAMPRKPQPAPCARTSPSRRARGSRRRGRRARAPRRPASPQVSWELWTTTNDQCGTLCQEQAAFIAAMKPISRALEQANKTAFAPHYVIWSCPIEYQDSLECTNECILNGTYCAVSMRS